MQKSLVKAPSNQTKQYRAQLRERRQKPSESLPGISQDFRIHVLVNLAYLPDGTDVTEFMLQIGQSLNNDKDKSFFITTRVQSQLSAGCDILYMTSGFPI